MPPPKKEVKAEEPLFVDEEGSYVHEVEMARYRGGVRRYTHAGSADAAAIAGGRAASPAPAGKGSGTAAAAAASTTSPPTMSAGGAGAGATATTTAAAAAAPGSAAAASSPSPGGASGAAPTAGGATEGGVLCRHGHGTYVCPSFSYEGEWEEDAMHGSGTLTFTASGNRYRGAFARGCFSGEGCYTWRDGAVYSGQWRANRMHGEGIYTDAAGHVWKGRYFNGTGPGLIRLYPTLESAGSAGQREGTMPSTGAVGGGGAGAHSTG